MTGDSQPGRSSGGGRCVSHSSDSDACELPRIPQKILEILMGRTFLVFLVIFFWMIMLDSEKIELLVAE
jgi:hypothetical protein